MELLRESLLDQTTPYQPRFIQQLKASCVGTWKEEKEDEEDVVSKGGQVFVVVK